MSKRIKMFMSTLLALCMVLSVVPAEILATESVSATVCEGSFDKVEESVIVPEDAAPLLDANCKILQYVDEEAFAAKGHVARIPGEETLSSYVFRNADGSRTVYYMDEPVKYMDSTGTVREKDLTLIPAVSNDSVSLMGTTAVAGYTTSSNDIGLTLPNDPTNGIRLTYGEDQIALIPQGGTGSATSQINEGAVIYPDYFGKGMSLRYTPTLNGVKEDIILKAYTGVNSFSFLLNTGGLRMYQDSGRYYLAASQNAETRFDLGDVVTFDAHGRFSVGTMSVETLTMGQSYRLTLTVDEDFLTDENTTYPITIDPTVTISNTSDSYDAIEDATIYSGAPNLNANWTYLHAGYYNSEYKIARTLFKFPSLVGHSAYLFPSEFQITSVKFHIKEATGSGPIAVGIYANSSECLWSETSITWNNAYITIGDQYATASPSYENEAVYDITNLVKAWQNGDENADAGFILKSSNETSVDKAFYATEWSTTSYRPYLEMDYIANSGGINYDVTDVDVGATKALHTYGISGTVTWTSSDTSIATVNSSGVVTGRKAGKVTITAKAPNYSAVTCTVYVTVADGVYYLGSNSGTYLAQEGGISSGTPVKLQAKSTSGVEKIRQLWKIKYIDDGYYSIRSLYKSDRCIQVTSNTANLREVSTSDTLSAIPAAARWRIEAISSGYILQNFWYTGNKQCMRPSGTDVVTSMFVSGNSNFTWTLTPVTSVTEQLLLINTYTGQTVTNAKKYVTVGDVVTLSDLNLALSFVSRSTNQTSYYWLSSNSSAATVGPYDGKITAVGPEKTTISVSTDNSNIAPVSFTIDVAPIASGTYYIRNWGNNLFMEINDTSTGPCIYGYTFEPNQSYQQWDVTYLGDQCYAIRSKQYASYYLGVANDSSSSGALIVPRTGAFTNGMKWKITKTSNGGYTIGAQSTSGNFVITNNADSNYCQLTQRSYTNGDAICSEWLFCEPSNTVIHEKQEQALWCWVTCAKMASYKYMNSPITQASAAFYLTFKDFIQARTLYPVIEESSPALQGGGAVQASQALEYILGWNGCTYYAEDCIYSEATLKSLLDAGNVVIISRATYKRDNDTYVVDSGHAYLIYGYAYDSNQGGYVYYLYDPLLESYDQPKIKSYSWICSAPDDRPNPSGKMMYWNWVVTYGIGNYWDTIKRPGPS